MLKSLLPRLMFNESLLSLLRLRRLRRPLRFLLPDLGANLDFVPAQTLSSWHVFLLEPVELKSSISWHNAALFTHAFP